MLTFVDVPSLAGFNASSQPNGSVASVGVVEQLYRLELTPPGAVAADGVNVVAATAPAGAMWARLGGWNQDARWVTNWFVDPAGNDSADGLTALTPVATIAEIGRRLSNVTLMVSPVVHLAAGALALVPFNVSFGADGLFLTIQGAVSSSAAITITGVTNRDPATSTRQRVQGATVFTDRALLRLTSGAQSGKATFVTNVIGAGDANVGPWVAPANVATSNILNSGNPAINDTFVVDTLLTTIQAIDVQCFSNLRGRVLIQDCFVSTQGASGASISHRFIGNTTPAFGGSAMCHRCVFQDLNGTSLMYSLVQMFNVYIAGQLNVVESVISAGALYVSGTLFLAYGAQLNQRGAVIIDGGQIVMQDISDWRSSSSFDVEMVDGPTVAAVDVSGGSSIQHTSTTTFWSANSAYTTGFLVQSGSQVLYQTLPTVAASVQDVLLGGVAHTYAVVDAAGGLMNTDNGALMARA